MAEYIMCITAGGGIPLLTRTKPGCPPLSFPVIGSLNGVHMFGLSRDATLHSTLTEKHRIVWKIYHDSVMVIAIAPSEDRINKNLPVSDSKDADPVGALQSSVRNLSSTITDDHLLRLIDNVFNSLVMLTGLDELVNIRNIDHLKKNLRACYKLVDTFLASDSGKKAEKSLLLFGDITLCVDVVLNTEAKVLQDHLKAFVEAADSTYGCLVVDGRVTCATEKWWLLDGQELALLGKLIYLLPSSVTSCDIPVFLPHISPDVPYRLLVFTLIVKGRGGVRACVLCGPEPSLSFVQQRLVERFWGPATNSLQRCFSSHSIPDSMRTALPSDLLAFLAVNTDTKRCVSYIVPSSGKDVTNRRKQQKNADEYEITWIYEKLVEFYKCTVGTSFPLPEETNEQSSRELPRHVGIAHYRCLKRHKCFATVRSQYQLFTIFSNAAPTFSLQGFTEKILDSLLKGGLF